MKSNIFIPKSIKVGYQKRDDTYTKKLAYVIYYDEKGTLRKEKSWDGWRNKDIEPTDLDNMPTNGFVLNKNVGDYDSGWNHRHAYIRVYDPRGFEFEISLENLLYILENTNSIKGKGLEGDFVYGWDGKDLVLLPCDSVDYKSIVEYNNIVHNAEKVSAKSLKIGATYLTKDNKEYIYMGKFNHYGYCYEYLDGQTTVRVKDWNDVPNIKATHTYWSNCYDKVNHTMKKNFDYGKKFWFYYDNSFTHMSSINNKIIKCVDEDCVENYSELYSKLEENSEFNPIDYEANKEVEFTLEEFMNNAWAERWHSKEKYRTNASFVNSGTSYVAKLEQGDSDKYTIVIYDMETNRNMLPTDNQLYTIEEIFDKMKPRYIQTYLVNGKCHERKYRYDK